MDGAMVVIAAQTLVTGALAVAALGAGRLRERERREDEARFERERAAWARERAALLERCLPGFVFPTPEREARPEAVDVDPEAEQLARWMRGEDL